MKSYKKMTLFLALLSLCILISLIIDIYGKYLTVANGNANIPIAKWNIVVNNMSIKNNSDISSAITPIFLGNDNIASNIIAPTAQGYFDLNFDFSNVDLSFSYEILVSASPNSAVSDLIATGYSIDGGSIIPFSDGNRIITDTIKHSDNIISRSIRIHIMWDDSSDTSSMNNIDDTLASDSPNGAILEVSIAFTQIT